MNGRVVSKKTPAIKQFRDGPFEKKILPAREGDVLKKKIDNSILSTELTMLNGHCKEIRKLTFRALALRQRRNCG